MLPVAVATLLNFGLMGWFDVSLSVTTALLSSMGIGIGVDYAIHFVFRYRRGRLSGLTREETMHETLSTSGVAIFYNAMVVLAGFLVLATSEFPPNRSLGVLVSLNMAGVLPRNGDPARRGAAPHPAGLRPPRRGAELAAHRKGTRSYSKRRPVRFTSASARRT